MLIRLVVLRPSMPSSLKGSRALIVVNIVLLFYNGREMSCTPDLGKMMTATFAVLLLMDY